MAKVDKSDMDKITYAINNNILTLQKQNTRLVIINEGQKLYVQSIIRN
jgi:frataxin-like iron-binding protein CyaY